MSESEETTPSAASSHDRDERGRFVIEPEAKPEPALEPVAVVEESAPEPEPESAPTPATVGKAKRKPAAGGVPSRLDGATVVLSALVYQAGMRNSASVAAVQDRLSEVGHGGVRGDKRGWLSDCTVEALRDFQQSAGLDVSGSADRETVEALFSGVNVTITD
jgi:Putative peptidoglycan binding domain